MAALASNRTSVPQIWIKKNHVGGCDELKVPRGVLLLLLLLLMSASPVYGSVGGPSTCGTCFEGVGVGSGSTNSRPIQVAKRLATAGVMYCMPAALLILGLKVFGRTKISQRRRGRYSRSCSKPRKSGVFWSALTLLTCIRQTLGLLLCFARPWRLRVTSGCSWKACPATPPWRTLRRPPRREPIRYKVIN